MSTSSGRIITKEIGTWDEIIKYYNYHNSKPHPTSAKFPACNTCYPIQQITEKTWIAFFDWYKSYFNAIDFCSETVNRYIQYRQAILKFINNGDSEYYKDEAFRYTYRLIGAIQYAFSPNYSIEDTGHILVNIGILTKGFVNIDNIVDHFRDLRDELRKQDRQLYSKPRSPSPPATTEIPLDSPKPKKATFDLSGLLNLGKKEKPIASSSTTAPGPSRFKTTTLRSGTTLNPKTKQIADELSNLLSELKIQREATAKLKGVFDQLPIESFQTSVYGSHLLEADQGNILESPSHFSDSELQDISTGKEENKSEPDNSLLGDILGELNQPSSSKGKGKERENLEDPFEDRYTLRNSQLSLQLDNYLTTEPIN
ncbi:MAG TPA: hypothetical protein VE593_04880, partial [Nitrososphaeraceae archaeon]|nr:hypothetical protein [Nitrososphaeraceae archaeon]